MLVEHARNVIGIADASHAEYGEPGTQIVTLLACSLRDNLIEIELPRGTRLHSLYETERATGAAIATGRATATATGRATATATGRATERTTCNYGLEPAFAEIARQGGLVVSAIDETGEVRAVERTDHPFFIATLFQPQLSSAPGAPHPIWTGFIRAVLG